MSDFTDKMIDTAWNEYSDELAESGVPSRQVDVAVAAALRVLSTYAHGSGGLVSDDQLGKWADEIEATS